MISTRETAPNPMDFFKLLVTQRFKNKWYGFLFSPLAALIIFLGGYDTSGDIIRFLLVFSVLYPGWVIGYYYVYAKSDKTLSVLKKRTYHFQDELLTIKSGDQVIGEIQLSKTNKIVERKTFLALYQSNGDFVFIPKNAFESEQEITEVQRLLAQHCKGYTPK